MMKTGTREWSDHSVNIQIGCEHGCRYCYAREMAVRFRRCEYDEWVHPIDTTLPSGKRLPGRIMFPTTHDITRENLLRAISAMDRLLAPMQGEDSLLIVSKPDPAVIEYICTMFDEPGVKERIEFRFTIGSMNDDILKFWEPGASFYEDRMLALKIAHKKGFATSVSIEPYLDDKVLELIKEVYPFVTTEIWVGMMNQIDRRVHQDEDTFIWINDIKKITTREAVAKIVRRIKASKVRDKVRWKDSIRRVMKWK